MGVRTTAGAAVGVGVGVAVGGGGGGGNTSKAVCASRRLPSNTAAT